MMRAQLRHVTIESTAIDEIVGDRFLQSAEFDSGRSLALMMTNQIAAVQISPKIRINSTGDGLFVTSSSPSSASKYLVIDIQQSNVFGGMTEHDTIFVLQKLLRFAKKAWQGLSFNFSERFISNTSKGVLFPFRGFKPAPFRITLERDPMPDRLAKRGDKGNFFLVYKAGYEGGDASKETAELTNFRKAYEALPDIRTLVSKEQAVADIPQVEQLQVIELPQTSTFRSGSFFRSFDDWLPLLTSEQRRFVETDLVGPFRIEGAAGTGKTLALILKALFALRKAKAEGKEFHCVFVTHSDATKKTVEEVIHVIDDSGFLTLDRALSFQSLRVSTLSELCAEQLRQSISETEFIDRDAMESKGLQLLYISEALADAMSSDFPAHERFLSSGFANFLKSEDSWKIAEMIQHEVSVMIKGRASEDLDKYKKSSPLRYGLPITSDADKGFVFAVFRLYQNKLGRVGQFDTDDVVLTTIGQMDTPIWRRRRLREGYDAIVIDETHLFNINELHLFHYFSKREGPYPIVYSVDRSQAVGDRGWTTDDIAQSLEVSPESEDKAKVQTIFRSSLDIINLAFSIVSSGATLFTNFDNPMVATGSAFTEAEERLTAAPKYINVPNEDLLIEAAFARAEQMQKDLECRRSDILIVTLDEQLLAGLQTFADDKKKPHLLLKRRGDSQAVENARQSAQIILAHADYVGGLEFFAVILVGIDGGRVPPTAGGENDSSKNYLAYAAHNRLYVAVTRARYRVELLGEKARGPSKILLPAISSGLLVEEDINITAR
ncbi:UNVERIFIED_ORG: hypothetical protein GGD47_001953 [Rhizobium etli]